MKDSAGAGENITGTESPEQDHEHGWTHRLRTLAVGILIAIGCVAAGVFVLAHWVERQILTTDNWVALVAPLPKQPVVSNALGTYLSDQLFNAAPVEQRIADALPPKASFLAKPLTDQLHGITTDASKKIVAGDGFQSVWTGANRIAMNRLVAKSRGQPTPLQQRVNERFDIDLSGASGQVGTALGSAANAIPALQPAANKAVVVSADLKSRADRVRQVVRTTDFLAATMPALIAASLLSALALSSRRRHTAMTITIAVVFVMLLELIGLKWLKQEILGQVRISGNLAAVGYIFDTLTGWLRSMIGIVIAIMAVLWFLCLAAGPAKWAHSIRSVINAERLRLSKVFEWVHAARDWIHHHERYLWIAAAAIMLIWLALVPAVTAVTIINAMLLTFSLFALIHIFASPHRQGEPFHVPASHPRPRPAVS